MATDPVVRLPEEEPWERLPNEPGRWFARFEAFRLMGPNRSLLGAVKAEETRDGKEKLSVVPPNSWINACKGWRWRERADAWDMAEIVRRRREKDKEREEAAKRHANIARMIQAKPLEGWEDFRVGDETSRDRLTWLQAGIAQERLALGEPTDIRQENHAGDGGPAMKVYVNFPMDDL